MNWNWNPEKTARWLEPAIEIPYLAGRWKAQGLLEVLDNGCGPGRHARYFAESGLYATAMDQSPTALGYLRDWSDETGIPVTIVEGNILHMPFEDRRFDAVLDYNASYHMGAGDFYRAVSEIRRVLRPGGELYMTLLSQNDSRFQGALPEEHLDEFTLSHQGSTPHFYANRQSLGEIFQGFSLINLREIHASSIDTGEERVHFHLLMKKD